MSQQQGPEMLEQNFETVGDGVLKVSTTFKSEVEFTRESLEKSKAELDKQLRQLMAEKRKIEAAIESVKHSLGDLADIQNVYDEKFGEKPEDE